METTISTASAQLVSYAPIEKFYANLGAQVVFGLAIIGTITLTVIFLAGFWNLLMRKILNYLWNLLKNIWPKRIK